jgi:outer membrane protein assembly factor BamE
VAILAGYNNASISYYVPLSRIKNNGNNMKKIVSVLAIIFVLSACVHKTDIEQGNVFTPEMANKLHTGMSEEQVKNIMGSPVLLNTFNDSRVDYVYAYRPGYGKVKEKYITLTFRGHRLDKINGNMYSQYIQ